MKQKRILMLTSALGIGLASVGSLFAQTAANPASNVQETLPADELALIRAVEKQRIQVINQVIGSVIAIYGPDQQGGGSGVIIDPSGIALTNHHVIQGAGLHGKGGLSDGKLYPWKLIGTDPGGDVAVIQMTGRDEFPFSPLGDSGRVRVGDWALAMGNPFLLAEDQVPTVTLGIISGVERFQGGSANQLVYGNCIQVDSSINPGNSGGPLFSFQGEVIGINGRGSFQDRGRVNVGLGYAISSNQIKNFLPDLLATKIVEHGTLDASFSERGGQVVCSTMNLDAPVAEAGLELGDRLIEFEGHEITYANQFKNLICTLPEDWPAELLIEKQDGRRMAIHVRLFGLPYNFENDTVGPSPDKPPPQKPSPDKKPDDAEKDAEQDAEQQAKDKQGDDRPDHRDGKRDDQPKKAPGEDESPFPPQRRPRGQPSPAQRALAKYLSSEPGVVIDKRTNQKNLARILNHWRGEFRDEDAAGVDKVIRIEDQIWRDGQPVGTQQIWLATDGRFQIEHQLDNERQVFGWSGTQFWQQANGQRAELNVIAAKTNPLITQVMCLAGPLMEPPFAPFGEALLDGGDKAQGQLCYRVMFLDERDDWFYCWLSCYDASGKPQVQLLKGSADKNCATKSRGMTFRDWRKTAGISLPHEKSLVSGASETVHWTAKTEKLSWLEAFDDSLFAPSSTQGEAD